MKEEVFVLDLTSENDVIPINLDTLEKQITGIHAALERLKAGSTDFRTSIAQKRNHSITGVVLFPGIG